MGWMEVIKGGGLVRFWNECNESGLNSQRHPAREVTVLHHLEQIMAQDVKEGKVEFYSPAIKLWALVSLKSFDGGF